MLSCSPSPLYFCLRPSWKPNELRFMKRAFPILAVVTALLLSFALYEALIGAPTERTMGDVQRIFYYHVPSAWTAFLLFLINFVASITYLINRHPAADILALTTPEVGVLFLTV